MERLTDMTVRALAELTASSAPAPGGGSISALAGALGAALTGMVAALSASERYEAHRTELSEVSARAEALRRELLEAVERDTASFAAYMAALALPKATPEEKARRADAMEAGLRQAAQVPLAAAERMTEIFPLAETVIRLGNPNAVTDALVAAAMARSGVLGAVFNVRVNLAGIRDQDFRRETEARLSQLERAARDGEAAVFRLSAIAAHLN